MNPRTDFSIQSILGGYDKNFTYIVTCSHSRGQVLIDAALSLEKLEPFLHNDPIAILITHTHSDHIAYLDEYVDVFSNITILGHPNSENYFSSNTFHPLEDEQKFNIGKLSFHAIHTPGHFHDSICYKLDPVLFTGDTLFVGRTGRVLSSKSDINKLYDSVYNKILTLPGYLRIFPGHDYGQEPTITLENNIVISPLLQAENFDDFTKEMALYEKNRTPES